DRRPHLAHPRRDRGRSEAPAPHPHRARRRLRVRAPPGSGRRRPMKRLYLQIYATLMAVLAIFALLWSWLWASSMSPHEERMFEGIGRVAGLALPPPDAPPAALEDALAEVSAALLSDVSVYGADGAL